MKINISKDVVKSNVNLGDVIVSNGVHLLVCADPQRGYFLLNLKNSTVYSLYHVDTNSLAQSLHCELIVRSHNLELNLVKSKENK